MHGRRAEAAVAPNGVPPRGAARGEGEEGSAAWRAHSENEIENNTKRFVGH